MVRQITAYLTGSVGHPGRTVEVDFRSMAEWSTEEICEHICMYGFRASPSSWIPPHRIFDLEISE